MKKVEWFQYRFRTGATWYEWTTCERRQTPDALVRVLDVWPDRTIQLQGPHGYLSEWRIARDEVGQ